jgi:hypothetical protein
MSNEEAGTAVNAERIPAVGRGVPDGGQDQCDEVRRQGGEHSLQATEESQIREVAGQAYDRVDNYGASAGHYMADRCQTPPLSGEELHGSIGRVLPPRQVVDSREQARVHHDVKSASGHLMLRRDR